MRRRVLIGLLALVLLVGVALAGRAIWQRLDRTPMQAALGSVDAKALRVAFTDWEQVRADVGARPEEDPDTWIERGYERDLTAGSSIDDSANAMREHFGFSPENADWEVFAQSREGAAMVLQLPGGTDFGALADKLEEAGFTAPSKKGRVWSGGVDLIPTLDPTLTPEVQYVALLEDEGKVVTSDTREYAARVVDVVRGDEASVADDGATSELVGRVGEPDTAVLWTGDFACEDLSMGTADSDAQRQAEQLIAEAGEITPVTGVVMALDDERLTVAEQFPDSDQAESNLRPRATLAVGPAVGRSEDTFADQLRLTSSKAYGATMVLQFKTLPDTSFPLSRLYDGPVLFASC